MMGPSSMGIPGIPSMAMGPMSVPGTGTTLTITRTIKQAKIIKNCNRADLSTPIAPPAFDTVLGFGQRTNLYVILNTTV